MGQLIKYATIQSITFVAAYVTGLYVATGGWNPVAYLKELSRIDGMVIDTYIRFDPFCQE